MYIMQAYFKILDFKPTYCTLAHRPFSGPKWTEEMV